MALAPSTPEAHRFDFFSIGQISLDSIVEHDGSVQGLFPGGGCLYPAVVAGRLGLRAAVYGKVGEDFPAEAPGKLRGIGLDTLAIRQVRGQTARLTISYPMGNEEERIDVTAGVGYDLSTAEIPEGHWKSRLIHISTAHRPFLDDVLHRARTQGNILLSFAPKSDLKAEAPTSLGRLISRVDAVFLNESELSLYSDYKTIEERLLDLASMGPQFVVVTLGARGSLIQAGDELHEVKAFHPPVVRNVCGAGDSYLAGFWCAYQRGCDLPDCGEFASRVATCVMGGYGLPFDRESFASVMSDPICQGVLRQPIGSRVRRLV